MEEACKSFVVTKNDRCITSGRDKSFMLITPTGDWRFIRALERGYFRYQSGRKVWEVALTDGTFLPLRRNTTAEQICMYSPFFIQIHQSYIINISYLTLVQDNHCVMRFPFDKTEELLISKKYKKEITEKFCQL